MNNSINHFLSVLLLALVFLISASQPTAVPLNTDHRVVVEGSNVYYNDKPLPLPGDISAWVEVLGDYSRKTEKANDVYIWDDIGVYVYTLPRSRKVKSFAVAFDDPEFGVHPTNAYQGGISVDGAAIGRESSIQMINKTKEADPLFSKGFADSIYYYDLLDEPDGISTLVTVSFSRGGKRILEKFSIDRGNYKTKKQ